MPSPRHHDGGGYYYYYHPHSTWLNMAAYAVIALSVVLTIIMGAISYNSHDKSNDSTSRNTHMYILAATAGFVIGIAAVSVIDIIHTKLTKTTPDGMRYISFKYSYVLAIVVAITLTAFSAVAVIGSHYTANSFDDNAIVNTIHTQTQNDTHTSFMFNWRLVPYTLSGVGIAIVAGMAFLTFLPHGFEQHKKLGILALMASVAAVVSAIINFSHGTNPDPPNKSQQSQGLAVAVAALVLAAAAAYVIFRKKTATTAASCFHHHDGGASSSLSSVAAPPPLHSSASSFGRRQAATTVVVSPNP